jgi:hypothetical protein
MNEWLENFKASLKHAPLAERAFSKLCKGRNEYEIALDVDNVVAKTITQDAKIGTLLGRDESGSLVPWKLDDSLFLGVTRKEAESLPGNARTLAEEIERVVGSSYWGSRTASIRIVNGMEHVTTPAHEDLPDALCDFAQTFKKVREATRRASQKELGLALLTLFGRFEGEDVPWEALAAVLSARYNAIASATESIWKKGLGHRFEVDLLKKYRKRYRPAKSA